MTIQGLYRTLTACLLIIILAACNEESGTAIDDGGIPPGGTGSNEDSGTTVDDGGIPPGGTGSNETLSTIVANAGPVIEVSIGGVVSLNGGRSTTSMSGSLSYAWSFNSKPDTSKAVIADTTAANTSFTADAGGTYMVQLVVSVGDIASKRSIVSVTVGDRPLYFHDGLSSVCVKCHDGAHYQLNGDLVVGKTATHLAASNTCESCHTTFGFSVIPYADHLEIFGNCSSCHNGVLAIGKSSWHIPTTVECDECHNTTSFLELEPDGSYNHSNISRACSSCHNGITAIGKHAKHPATSSECNFCHTIKDFTSAYVDHSGPDVVGKRCDSCHNGSKAKGKSLNHPDTGSNDCVICHNTDSFNLGGVFNHRVIDSISQPCSSCHNDVNATGKSANHIATDSDCAMCHNTRTFIGATIDHTPYVDNCARSGCHDGVDPNAIALGKPVPPNGFHMLTTEDCSVCHTPGNFATGVFDHNAAVVDPVNCDSCHNDQISAGKPVIHVPTSDDCRVCHDTTTFTGATVDHSTIVGDCATCHNGSITTGKPRRTHLPTLDECNSCHSVSAFSPSASFAHQGVTGGCQACHNGQFTTSVNTVKGKPTNHIPTVADCITCHSTSAFTGATFTHSGITRGCEGCHNGRFTTSTNTIKGKPTGHLPTSQDCYLCHTTTGFTDTSGFAHREITGNCTSCHNGSFANIGARAATDTATHRNTTADCGVCHNTINFFDAFVDHTSPTVVNVRCDSCHNNTPQATAIGKNNGHVTTTEDCNVCHLPGTTFVPAVFDHSNLNRNTRCDSCHGVTAKGTDAKISPPHIPVQNGDDCKVCHNTTDFAGATFDHQGITNNCVACHNGNTATGKPVNHVPTSADCVDCHKTTGFVPGTFDHVGIVSNCTSCHDGVFATGKISGHVTTSLDCGACHSTSGFLPATFNHTGITDNCTRSGCHTEADKNTGHLATNLGCHFCHNTLTFVGGTWVHDSSTAGICKSCHNGTDATGQPANGRNGHFDTTEQCDACHTTQGWAPASTFDHCPGTNSATCSANQYPGDHNRNVGCINCHTNNSQAIRPYPSDQYAGFCAACHEGDFRRKGDHIGGSNGTVAQNKNCGASGCHRVSGNGF